MAEGFERVPERLDVIERRPGSLDSRTNARFDQVDEAFVEQRRYTECAFEQLSAKMDAGFAEIHRELRNLGGGLGEVRGGLDEVRGGLQEYAAGLTRCAADSAHCEGISGESRGSWIGW